MPFNAASIWYLSLVLDLTFKCTATKPWIPSSPYSREFKQCNSDKYGYICDPDKLLAHAVVKSVNGILYKFSRTMPCFCHQPCSRHESNQNLRFVLSVLVMKNMTRSNITMDDYAELVRKKWNIGQCNGNDVLLLMIGKSDSQFAIAYGTMAQYAIGPDCATRLNGQLNPNKDIIINIKQITQLLHDFLLEPCLCRSCTTIYYWLKIPAMLFGCFCLLFWLTLIGRRAYLRRKSFYHSSSNYSVNSHTFRPPNTYNISATNTSYPYLCRSFVHRPGFHPPSIFSPIMWRGRRSLTCDNSDSDLQLHNHPASELLDLPPKYSDIIVESNGNADSPKVGTIMDSTQTGASLSPPSYSDLLSSGIVSSGLILSSPVQVADTTTITTSNNNNNNNATIS